MNTPMESIAHFLWTQTWQLACLGIVLVPVVTLLSKKRPHLAILFCYLLIAKALLPPSISHTKSVFHWVENHAELSTDSEIQNAQNESPTELPMLEGISGDIHETGDLNLGLSTEVESTREATPIVSPMTSSEPRTPLVNRTRIFQAVSGIWASGIVLSGLLIVLRHRKFRQLILRAEPIDSPELLSRLARLQADLGIKKKIPLKKIDSMISPAVVGWRKPVILIPSELIKTSSPDELTPIIAHELLHIRRGDLTISLLQCLAQVIWWFHPAIWIVNRRINHLREACCDGEVLHHVKISSTSYAQALLNVVKQTPKISIPRYVSAVRSVEVTTQRIEKLMKTPQHLTHRTPIYGLLLTLGFAIFALPSAKIVSAEKKAKITDTVAESQVTESPIPTSPENPEKSSIVDIKQQFPQRFENQRTIPFPKNNRQVSIRRDGVLKVSRGKLYITGRSISGTVIPRNQLHIQSKVDGTVRRVNLTPGTKVKKGDLLLELTNDKLESALQEAELDLDTARTEIQQNQTLKEQEYLNAKSTLQEAELQLELRENEYSRKKSLFEKKLISKEDLSNAQNSLKQQKQILSFQLQSIEIMARKSEQSQKLKNLQLERFLLARESILRQLDDLRILAPMQGTIAPLKSSTDILIGTYVKAATPLAKLINVDQLTVRASYPADDISEIEEGMACQVRVNGNEHGGKIGTIYPTADMNRKVTFLVELTSPSSNSTRIIPGSIARVYVVRGEKADVLSVAQRSSNMIEGTHMMVYKISPFGNTATETEVTFGEQGMGRIEITGPLEEGDQISQTNHGFTRKLSDHRNITVLQNKEIAR